MILDMVRILTNTVFIVAIVFATALVASTREYLEDRTHVERAISDVQP
jgi:hypothetical protein